MVCTDDIATPPARSRLGASDAELIEAVAAGDERAFALLYRRTERRALSLALRICAERPLAEEAFQEAFVSIWRRASLFDPRRGEAAGWISTIVHNESVNVLRRRGAALVGAEQALTALADDGAEGERRRREREVELRRALLTLPGEQSSVIELVYFGGYSIGEVASMSSTPLGTVKSRMRLGIEKLRTQMAVREQGA